MSSWWDILDIKRDADLRSIKSAYAKKLKTIHQEDDPEAFMELREAYEDAQGYLHYAKSDSYQSERQIHVTTASHKSKTDLAPHVEKDETLAPALPTILDDVKALMKNPWGANNLDKWNEIFDDERVEAIDDFTDFEQDLMYYLVELYSESTKAPPRPILSLPVAELIFERFRWTGANNNNGALTHHINWLETQINNRLPSHLTDSKATPIETQLDTSYGTPKPHPSKPKRLSLILGKATALAMLGAYIYWVSTLFH